MLKNGLTLLATVLFWLISAANEAATVPMTVTHQGRLMDGATPANGFFDIEYDIYPAATGGTSLWTETHTNVEVKDGLFTSELGKTSGFFDICCYGEEMWLEIHVVGDPTPISPRTKLGGAPSSAMSHSVGSSHPILGSLDTAKIDLQTSDQGSSLRLRVVPTAQTTGRGVSAKATQQGGEIAIGDPDFDLLRMTGDATGANFSMTGDPDFDLLRMSAGPDTAKIRISGQSSGDPDFDLLRIVGGKGIGDGDVSMAMTGDPDFDLLRLSANADSAEISMSAQDIGDPDFDLLRMIGRPKFGEATMKVKNSIGNIRGITTEVDSATVRQFLWTQTGGPFTFKSRVGLSSDDSQSSLSISNAAASKGLVTTCAPAQTHLKMFNNDDTTVSITSNDTETSLSISNAAGSKGVVSACAQGQSNISATRDGNNRVMVTVDDTSSSIAIGEEGVQITMRADTGLTNPTGTFTVSNAAGTKGIATGVAAGTSSLRTLRDGAEPVIISTDASSSSIAINEEGIEFTVNVDSGGTGSIALITEITIPKFTVDSDGDGYLSNSLKIGTSSGSNHIEVVGGANCDGTTWNNASDVNSKENFQSVDGEEILEKLEELDITRWNYKGKDEAEHIGPTAQDFYKAFGVGTDDMSISTVDPSGIALAAIKELYKKSKEVDELKKQLEELAKQVEKLATDRK